MGQMRPLWGTPKIRLLVAVASTSRGYRQRQHLWRPEQPRRWGRRLLPLLPLAPLPLGRGDPSRKTSAPPRPLRGGKGGSLRAAKSEGAKGDREGMVSTSGWTVGGSHDAGGGADLWGRGSTSQADEGVGVGILLCVLVGVTTRVPLS